MDQDLERLSLSRGSLGVEQQRIDNLKAMKEESRIALKSDEANQIEADMISVISQLNARQVSYEASLRLLASANQLSLFNYL
jgi:flagellar hook-associated protein 3 FlgL